MLEQTEPTVLKHVVAFCRAQFEFGGGDPVLRGVGGGDGAVGRGQREAGHLRRVPGGLLSHAELVSTQHRSV